MKWYVRPVFSFASVSLSFSAHAWWDQGHQLVSEISENAKRHDHDYFLTLTAKNAVQALLWVPIENPGSVILSQNTNTIAKAASWADSIKSYKNQGNTYSECHYSDAPIQGYDVQITPNQAYQNVLTFYLEHKKTQNSISCLKSAIKVLEVSNSTDVQKAIAVRMIIHIMGDISQPFHSAEHDLDKGGNNLILKQPLFIKGTNGAQVQIFNMHGLMDSTMGYYPQYIYKASEVKNGIFSDEEVNNMIKTALEVVEKPELKSLSVNAYESHSVSMISWVAESYLTAQNKIYYQMPVAEKDKKTGMTFVSVSESDPYFQNTLSVIEPAIYTSGVRLAKLLTAIFDKDHAESGYVDLVQEITLDPEITSAMLFP